MDVDQDGDVDLPAPGGDLTQVAGALDCDLGRSPVTKHPAIQRYEHLRLDPGGGAVVRYQGAHRGVDLELTLDAQGFVGTGKTP